MPGFMPGIHVLAASQKSKSWMRGPSPRMTDEGPRMTIERLGAGYAPSCRGHPRLHYTVASKAWMASEVGLARLPQLTGTSPAMTWDGRAFIRHARLYAGHPRLSGIAEK